MIHIFKKKNKINLKPQLQSLQICFPAQAKSWKLKRKAIFLFLPIFLNSRSIKNYTLYYYILLLSSPCLSIVHDPKIYSPSPHALLSLTLSLWSFHFLVWRKLERERERERSLSQDLTGNGVIMSFLFSHSFI